MGSKCKYLTFIITYIFIIIGTYYVFPLLGMFIRHYVFIIIFYMKSEVPITNVRTIF